MTKRQTISAHVTSDEALRIEQLAKLINPLLSRHKVLQALVRKGLEAAERDPDALARELGL